MSTHQPTEGHGHEAAKPCPFCASTRVKLYAIDEVWWRVECRDCSAAGPHAGTEDDDVTEADNKDAAVNAWNHRQRPKKARKA
jgi:Lar family restriction alleviation protein